MNSRTSLKKITPTRPPIIDTLLIYAVVKIFGWPLWAWIIAHIVVAILWIIFIITTYLFFKYRKEMREIDEELRNQSKY